jgi:uncharacterized protein YeaC (DUF1315 family)
MLWYKYAQNPIGGGKMVLVLVTKQDGHIVEYNENMMEVLERSGQVELVAADYFDLYACTPEGAQALRDAVEVGNVYVGKDVPDGRYISAGGDEVYVLGGRVVSEEEFVEAKWPEGLQLLRDGDTETLKDMLAPWTW